MFKIWISLLVLTIFGAFTVNGLRVFLEMWTQKCKKAGVEWDSEKDFRDFQEFNNCSITSLNETQLMEDIGAMIHKFKLAELPISTIKPTLQKYCSQIYTYLNCTQNLSTECYTEQENLRWTIDGSYKKSFIDFFCKNDASMMTEFINGKGIECGMTEELELMLCFGQFSDNLINATMSSALMGDMFILRAAIPPAELLCNSLDTVGNCVKQLFQKCKLSETPAKLIADLLTYIEKETKCATIDRNIQHFNSIQNFFQNDTSSWGLRPIAHDSNSSIFVPFEDL